MKTVCENRFKKEDIRERIKEHPCYCEKAHQKFARIHLPVAPKCNIQCNYCNRKYDCANESRPGVTSKLLTPEEALEKYLEYSSKLPNLTVVGIAGPGDPLANPYETFKTFELIRNASNKVKLCLSTNGLKLSEYIYEIKYFQIEHITVTVNTVDENIGSNIYKYIKLSPKKTTGIEGANILLERQLAGIESAVASDLIIKVNTVLIPGINDANISMVSRKINQLGVFIHNIVPLINPEKDETFFSKKGVLPPTEEELGIARLDASIEMGGMSRVMKHCKQCRADAVGILGNDLNI